MARLIRLTHQFKSFFNRVLSTSVHGNNAGTSIVEVIFGMVILAMLVAGLNAGVLSLVNTNKTSKEIAAASNFGYEKLEEIRRTDYTDITTALEKSEGFYKYDVRVTITGMDGEDTQRTVSIDIRWPSTVENPKHQISLSTIIAKP